MPPRVAPLDLATPYAAGIDANPYALLDELGRAPGATLSVDPAVSRLESDVVNATYRIRLVSDRALESLIEVAGPGRGPWWLGPSTTPPEAADVLDGYGFDPVDERTLMTVAVADLPTPDPVVALTRVPAPAVGLSSPALLHYVATVDGAPVASATVLPAAGVAGLYFVTGDPTLVLPALADTGLPTALVAARPSDVEAYRRLGFRRRDVIRMYY